MALRNIKNRFDLTGFNLLEASMGGKGNKVCKAARKIDFYIDLFSKLNVSLARQKVLTLEC